MNAQRVVKSVSTAALCMMAVVTAYAGDDFGIVTDIAGRTDIKRGSKNVPVSVGTNLAVGDNLLIGKNSKITVVSYDQCLEWTLKGPVTTEMKYGSIQADGKKLRHDRRLPVCYSMTAVNAKASDHMGGIVLRGGGPKDPVAELREEFIAGTASNSTVLTLLMHDLNNGNIEKSKPYYDELKRRIPEAEIIARLAPVYEKTF